MKTVAYMGYSVDMINALNNNIDYDLKYIVGKKGRLSEEYYIIARNSNALFFEINDQVEVLKAISVFHEIDAIFIYRFEYIIPKELVKSFHFINFHGGDLRTNRGAHALVWSILLREPKTMLSCYEISGDGIDEGYLIDTFEVKISNNDTPSTLYKKMISGIPELLEKCSEYLNNGTKGPIIEGGVYRRKIKKSDFTINFDMDSIDEIRAKILSQQPYYGAIVVIDGKEYRVKDFKIRKAKSKKAESGTKFIKISNEKVILTERNRELVLWYREE